jgi:molybdopterin converting factor small subunit
MAYPEHIKKRAIELKAGLSAGKVLEALREEFPNENYLPFERTIRRWYKAKPAIPAHSKQRKPPPSVLENRKEHNAKLAGVADRLLANDLKRVRKWVMPTGDIEYQLFDESEENLIARLTDDDLSGRLEENLLAVYRDYTEWFYENCFLPHLFAEWSEDVKTKMSKALLYEQPYLLIETLRLLAERKTFKGICLVCKDWQ